MTRIKDIIAREILDSRGNPTIEVDVKLENGIVATASVPSGASTGTREAVELRDNDKNRYLGKGVLNAVYNVEHKIKPRLVEMEYSQFEVDKALLSLDSSPFRSNLGANSVLAVSLACLKAGAMDAEMELYEYITNGKVTMPIPMMNVINGGKHADNNVDIQEFMIVPVVKTFKERLRVGTEVFHNLKAILKEKGLVTGVGDEGGFAPELSSNEEALSLIHKAIVKAGYIPGKDVFLALDVAASEFFDKTTRTYKIDGQRLITEELMQYYQTLIEKYPILSIEDPFYEDDFEALAEFTRLVGNKIMIVGDDYFVTNKKYLKKGITLNAGNAILLKANQVGTVSQLIETIALGKKHDYKLIMSHRSGETEDTFIADFAVGLSTSYIKTGAPSRGERVAKYNRLLRIEEKIMNKR